MESFTYASWIHTRYFPSALCSSCVVLLTKILHLSILHYGCSFQASYGVEDPEYAVTQLAQTTMRSELGKLSLDKVFRVRAIVRI